jgi:glycosyltransferase involved in cell wall biosynthesis
MAAISESSCNRPSAIRVLHVAQPTFAGVMVVVRDLVKAQISQGLDVTVACPESGGELSRQVAEVGARWVQWEASRNPGRSVFSELRALTKVVHNCSPDIVHLHSSKAGLAGRLAIRGRIPTIFEPNAWSFLAVSGVMYQAATRWERWAARWTDTAICVSEDEQSTGKAIGIRCPMQVIRNGIQLDKWPRPVVGESSQARSKLGIAHDALHIVSVGRLCRQKGQDILLTAWPQVRQRFPNARLTLVGEGSDRKSLERLADASVTFAGESKAVRDWYLSADLVVMPSRWEGLSLALLEAMATERTVVAFNVEGMKDALSDGVGLLVAPESVTELGAQIVTMLSDPDLRNAIAAKARGRVEGQFDIRKKGSAVLSLYEQVLSLRGAAAWNARLKS